MQQETWWHSAEDLDPTGRLSRGHPLQLLASPCSPSLLPTSFCLTCTEFCPGTSPKATGAIPQAAPFPILSWRRALGT